MSTEKPSFIVAVELTAEYDKKNPDARKWMLGKNAPHDQPRADIERFLFRSEVEPIDPAIDYKPGFSLHRVDADPSTAEGLPDLPFPLRQRIHEANYEAIKRNDSRDDAPIIDFAEYEQDFAQRHCHDEPPRASVNPAKPNPAPLAPDEPRIVWIEDPFAPLDPPDWVCEGLQIIRGGRIMSIAAYGGTGKSLSMMSAYVSMAANLPIWGADHLRVSRPLTVAHLDADQGEYATKLRLQRLCRAKGLDFNEIRPRIRISKLVRYPLTHPKAIDIYLRALEGVDFALFDALRGFTTGIDENDSRVRDQIDKLTFIGEQTKTAICLIHHQGKPREDGPGDSRFALRGSSAIFDACGTVFKLEGKPDEMTKTLTHIKPAAESTGGVIPKCYLIIEDVPIDGNPLAGVRVVHRSAEEQNEAAPAKPKKKLEAIMRKMLEHVKINGGISTRSLYASIEGSTKDKPAARDELVRLGYLQIQKGAKRNEADKNFATGAGLAWLGGNVVHVVTSTPTTTPSAPQDAPTTPDTTQDSSTDPNDAPKDA